MMSIDLNISQSKLQYLNRYQKYRYLKVNRYRNISQLITNLSHSRQNHHCTQLLTGEIFAKGKKRVT
jgi:hypothetical protein